MPQIQLTRLQAAGMLVVAQGQRGSLEAMRLAFDVISVLSLDTSGWVRVVDGKEVYDLGAAREVVAVELPLAQASWLQEAMTGWSQYTPADINQWAQGAVDRLKTHIAALRAT